MFTLFVGIALIKDTQQGFQFITMFFPQPPHLDDITVVGETFYKLLFLGQSFFGGMVVIISFHMDNRTVIMLKIMSKNINTDNGKSFLFLRFLARLYGCNRARFLHRDK